MRWGMKKEIYFYSEGFKIAGDLYIPDNYSVGDKFPAIILCHGFAGFKELLLPAYAESFAKNGYITIVFDYRGFGASEGERGRLVPQEQIVDIRNTITYIETLPEVDTERIGLWGTSFGGANAILTAAIDNRVKCLVVQLTFGSGERVITGGQSDEEKTKLQTMLKKSWQRAVTKNKHLKLSVDQILTDQQSKDFFKIAKETFPEIAVKIPILTLQQTIEYIPENFIFAVKVPIFIVAAEKDNVNPLKESEYLFEKANHPKSFYCVKGATHYEVYEGKKFEVTVQKQIEWFNKYLVG